MYSSRKAKEKRKAFNDINKIIDELESAPDLTSEAKEVLKKQQKRLNGLLKIEAQGALVRSRFKHTTEVDTCSTYCNAMRYRLLRYRFRFGLAGSRLL